MRQDIYLYNDAGSWSVIAGDAVAQIVADHREHDLQFVEANKVALFSLEGDDYSVIRVVTNEPLTEIESSEWIARARWRLKIINEQVLIAGGFDPDCLHNWMEAGDSSDVQAIALPSGDYQVVLYTYLHSMNGAVWLSDDFTPSPFPKLSQWFRQDHPNSPLPTWLAAMFAYEDVDTDDEWYPIQESVKLGRITIAEQPLHWIGYLIHLVPFSLDMEIDRPDLDGWFEPRMGLRIPAQCPLGVATDLTEDRDLIGKLDWIMGSS
ncbi:hypothetical protein Syn7502_01573 [Synechococcus sp. PCC 7502]|uniref:hypothetical protein n=1 Tax=Synechococcus sp. PCC 7502 TaxID=1173263 RepID=UPI00029F9CF7|nr:hypothetical protein [Synechococcus sp. PCC 7502]AFY73633.1 hypothetical protein Syn7502_01573 [Synechococcus sp. PCC 7502]